MSEPLLKHSRMPRKYDPQAPVGKPSGSENYGNLSGVPAEDLLKRYLSDESTKDIADSYDVTRQALGRYLIRHAEDQWKEAQVARAIARKEAAEDALEVAPDPLALAKARELLKAAQWDLERTCRRIYGEDKVQGPTITPILTITVAGPQGAEQPRTVQVSYAHTRDETHSHVLSQQYDSRAPQHEAIIDASPVDNTPK